MEEYKTIDYLLRNAWLSVQRMYNEEASHYQSTMVIAFTLLSIDPKDGTSSTTLGPKMGIEATSMTRTIKNLEEKGLIVKIPNPNDGRGIILKLTESGLKMRDISRETVLRFNEHIEQEISKKELETFKKVAEKICEIVNKQKIFL